MLRTVKEELFSESLKLTYRVAPIDFTRNRKQSFPLLLIFMLNMLRSSLSLEIENFFSFLKASPSKKFSKSAFVQARKKIKPQVFKHLNQSLIGEFYTDNDQGVKTWKGFRLLAVDGSRITLPLTRELKRIYGQTKNQTNTSIVQARCSVLYDLVNNYILDGGLSPISIGERAMALSHFHYCKKGDLILYDRGYPSYDFIHQHIERDLDFVMRVRTDFSKQIERFVSSNKVCELMAIYPSKTTKLSANPYDKKSALPVRLVKVVLCSGQTEILITSLKDHKQYPKTIFKKLYNKRWGVETYYDQLKNKLKVEHFSGYSNQSIQQDFYAALLVSNIQTLIVAEVEEEINQQNKGRKYHYKVNTNLSYGFLKNKIIGLLFSEHDTQQTLQELRNLFKAHLIPIRPERSFKRNVGKYKVRIKPKITKNHKDAL